METNAVRVPVIAAAYIECIFWPETDGWTGVCESLSLNVRGSNFEETKKNLEAALHAHVEFLIRRSAQAA
jgi:hypothetical protein